VVFEAIAADAPLREVDGGLPAEDTIAASMLAKTLCRLEDVERYLALHGIVDGDGSIRPAVEVERRLRADVGDSLDALGMTPRARARLGLDIVRAVSAGDQLAEHIARTHSEPSRPVHFPADVGRIGGSAAHSPGDISGEDSE
jgi:hypothetical protein